MTTFIDTSFLVALVLRDDALRRRALAWEAAITGNAVTTEFILLEFANFLSHSRVKALVQVTIDRLRSDSLVEIIPVDSSLLDEGYRVFCSRLDKNWSLTDCISFHVMNERGITAALTHDHHFEQAGFRALLREDPPSN